MKNLNWTIQRRKVSELIAADYNPRKMTEQEERDLEESIAEFGAVIPVVVNIGKRKDVLIGGHQRTRLYTKKGIEEVDVMVPSRELTIAEEKRLNLRLNKNVGSWDQEKLREMGLDLLLDVGFGDEDLQVFFDDVDVIDDSFNTGRAIKDIKNPKAKNGDIYQLGEHRLMCGDATDIEQVHELMGKNHADMIFNDPPLTLKNEGHVLPPSKEMNAVKPFLDTYNACYIFNSDVMFRALLNGIDRAGYYYSQMLIWVKNSVVVGRKDYLPMHEAAAYCWHGRHKMNRPKSKSVIFHPKPASSKLHPTMKPVGLLRKIIPNNTRAGEVVYDPFGGSGSTLIASEHLGRKCVMIELDPGYCQTIIERWETLTGKQATKI